MEIRDFAERVLFAGTLEEKLAGPEGVLTDVSPGPALTKTPDAPGRPEFLRFAGRGETPPPPKGAELETEEGRAILLHLFANHELLAVELMALALLKFPDAPPAFRRGLLRTLREEQEHTRLYMERMKACGLRFGDLPVNGFFWRNIADMESPLDYVSRFSLTFEQANLDYARHYGGLFRNFGDLDTAALLDRIYRDEIAHVGYGLKWFRRWKAGGVSDWDAWAGGMRFPLSPARARGNAPFNREGRLKAGLDPAFIDRLELFSQSRGRTPVVTVFNPSAEACALTNDPAEAERGGSTATLARDLDILPLFTVNKEDVVLVRKAPSAAHLARLLAAGISPAQFEVLDARGRIAADSPLRERKLARLRPWGWSADSAELLKDLLPNAGEAAFASIPWDGEIRELYAKTTAARLARTLAEQNGLPEETAGVVAESEEEVAEALRRFAANGHAFACLKAPFGIAGRGVIRVNASGLTERDLTWLRPVLHRQRAAVVEPWLERIADFSCQYELVPGRTPRLKGMVRLYNDAGGRFLGCAAGPAFTRLLSPEGARALHEFQAERFYRETLPAGLAALPGLNRLHGCLGIDAFLYRGADGRARVRPLVEINPRCTMGRVTLELRRFADPAKVVTYRVLHRKQMEKHGWASPAECAAALAERDPAQTGETASGRRVVSGTLTLNDFQEANAFLALMSVGPRPAAELETPA